MPYHPPPKCSSFIDFTIFIASWPLGTEWNNLSTDIIFWWGTQNWLDFCSPSMWLYIDCLFMNLQKVFEKEIELSWKLFLACWSGSQFTVPLCGDIQTNLTFSCGGNPFNISSTTNISWPCCMSLASLGHRSGAREASQGQQCFQPFISAINFPLSPNHHEKTFFLG